MKRIFLVVAALTFFAAARSASAADAPTVSVEQLAGNTLSAVVYMSRPAGMPGGGELVRVMLQAYLGADGRALVRAWDPSHDAYTAPAALRWSLTGSTFCIDVPMGAAHSVCAGIHVWGPRIAGIGVKPYAMLDGDLQPGNKLVPGR
jgi:hypothetical protein